MATMTSTDIAFPAPPWTILVVDDDDAVLNSLRFSLELDGMAVRGFHDGRELLAAVLPERGCLVVDLKLPERDGLEVIAALRRRGVTLPAILITSDPSDATRRRALAANVPIVEKPHLDLCLPDLVRSSLAAPAG